MGGSEQKAAGGAVGGKSARACDGCMKRRARWYCAADDAFLCQSCDTSVHSANPLARRHERLRLRATSTSPLQPECVDKKAAGKKASSKRLRVAPAWLKRKARTRRPAVKSVGQLLSRRLVVPEVGAGESSDERRATEEEQLLYRVPIFDPALGEFCSPPPIDDAVATAPGCREDVDGAVDDTKEGATAPSPVQELPDCFASSFGPTDAELSEFAADMEALLGQGLDDSSELGDSFYMEAPGLISPAGDSGRVKVEADGGPFSRSNNGVLASGPGSKPELNCSPPTLVDDDDSFEHKMSSASNGAVDSVDDAQFLKRSLDLRLNFEAVIESWGSSPWTDGQRPHDGQLDDLLLHDHSGMWTVGGGGLQGEAAWKPRPRADGWREARVSRYREKRRTRLFAKKIRYEVRKLNAEKRPRMKGRFVKRTGAALAAATPCAVT